MHHPTSSILDERQPADFSLEKLRNGVPMSWVEQRKRFGFPAPSYSLFYSFDRESLSQLRPR
jgi:hypothetical protein